MVWNECPEMADGNVKRWIENEDGDIISVVTGNSKGNMRIGIDGEIRCSINFDCFSIPCTLSVVAKKTTNEIIQVAERASRRRNS